MSGFLACVNGCGAPVDRSLLRRMTETMVHRGPDALRTHAAGNAGIGHALNLVSTDASRDATQFFVSGDIWLSGDFRLHDRETLTSTLRNKHDPPTGNLSDGALLLAAYRAFGTSCLDHLRGEFAFAIWDIEKKRLLLARDHFGVKPLFYACRNKTLCACSTVDALRILPFVSDNLDDRAMAEFLSVGLFMSLDISAYADIRRLPPGHALTFECGKLRSWRYWSLPVPEQIRYRKTGQYLEHFREVMQRSVDDRLTGDSVGIHLSGGMDSALISATVKNSARRPRIRGYTVVFDHLIPDRERHFARATAKHLDFAVEFLSADGFLPYARWGRTPEPIQDPFYFNQRTQYRDLVAHSRVALSGHGGDELFLGSYVADLFGRLPVPRIAADLLGCFFIHGVRPPFGIRTVWQRRRGGPTAGRRPPPWIRGDLVERFDLTRRVGELTADWAPSPHPIRPQAFRLFTSPIWPAILEQEDANFTGQPVEVRYPFFDLRVAEFLLALPPLPWCTNKFIARKAMKNRLPEAVRQRPKSPVSEDVLTAHWRASGAHLSAGFPVTPALSCYIEKERLPSAADLLNSSNTLWLRMAPVSLALWLTHNGIKPSDSRHSGYETDRPRQNGCSAREATVS